MRIQAFQFFPILAATVFSQFYLAGARAGEESGPDIVPVAEANNPQPKELPTIRVVKEKLWGQYYPMVSMRFPNVPEFQCDAWCYESDVELVDAKPFEGGAVEMRHRDKQNPQTLVITTIRPTPGAIEFEARVELDTKEHASATLPAPPGLNLCWQLRHAPGFASKPDPYPEFVKRCFIFTERGRTFLLDTDRTKIPVQTADHEYNNPPWVQSYVSAAKLVPVTPAKSWAGYSPDRYLTPVIGAVSRDGKYLAAIANDSAAGISQAWHDCAHNNPKWLPESAPVTEQRWRLCVYAMENDPKALMERVAKDFPKEKRAAATAAEKPAARDGYRLAAARSGWVEIASKVRWMKSLPLGPFVRLKDGGLLGVSESKVIVSHDEGVTWETRPLFAQGQNLEAGDERSLIRTVNGTLILVFMNMADFKWGWNKETSLTEPGTRLPVWAIRSLDEGQTWIDAQMIYDGYCGDIHDMIQTRDGHVIAPVQELMYDDGRHALRPRYSTDDGKTWQRANLLDIGGRGNHDGLIEATLAERKDGVVWMLCRTNLGKFWSAFSDDHGEHWRVLQPSDIPASSAPGTFLRLASGRLLLVWNRPTPEGSTEIPPEVKMAGDRQWADVPCSNYRAELSVALSSDDGKTWSKPIVVARRSDAPRGSLAYSYVFEPRPGEVWITTMQGDLRLSVREADLVTP